MPPRSFEANEQVKDKRRGQIMLAALKIFTRKGFSATKMSNIADEAGISYGLVYHYFKSKEDVYVELIKYAVDSIGKMINEINDSPSESALDKIRKIVSRVLSSVENKETSAYYYVLMINAITNEAIPVSSAEIINEAMEQLSLFTDIISEGQKEGQIREGDPKELAVTSFSTVIGLASLKVSGAVSQIPDMKIIMRLFR